MAHTQQEVLDWLASVNTSLSKAAADMVSMPVTIMPPGNLSPHFTLAELTASDTAAMRGIDNTPDANATEQLSDLANDTLEGIRTICKNNPVIISSGYRCPELNAAIGGATNSAHKYGCAADFTVPGFGNVKAVCKAIEPYMKDLGIDQLIYENNSWVHVGRAIPPSTTPRMQALTINGSSTTTGIA